MNTTRFALVSVLALASLPMPAAAAINVDYDRSVDFSRFETFSWATGTAANAIVQKRIVAAVERELEAAGLRKVEGNGDLRVSTHVSTDEETRVDIDDYGYNSRWRGWGSPTTVQVRNVLVGMLVVDLVDGESKQLVWRGVGKDTVGKSPEKNEKKINKAVKKMFKKYPR